MAPLKWFLLAVQFATVAPVPSPRTVSEEDVQKSVLFFPVVGLLLGLLFYVVRSLLLDVMPNLPATVVSLTVYTLATGALHIDGLMDTADAIGSRKPREAALAIMKDSRVGAMGAVAGVLLLLGKVSAVSALTPYGGIGIWHTARQGFDTWHAAAPFVVVPAMSRLAMVWSMVLAPSAKKEGLSASFARKVPAWVVLTATVLGIAACLLFLPVAQSIWVLVYSALATGLFTGWMTRRFGGMTGDTYGALNEVVEWLGWFVFAAIWM